MEVFPALRQHSEPVRPVNVGNKQANTPSSWATTKFSTFFSFWSQYWPPGGGILPPAPIKRSIYLVGTLFFKEIPQPLEHFSRSLICPIVLFTSRGARSRLELSEVIWESLRESLGSDQKPFLRLSCRLTMGYCCSGYSSDTRHLWRENSSVVTEGKYSSLGPERNHMCLVFNQPVWILQQGSEKQQKGV